VLLAADGLQAGAIATANRQEPTDGSPVAPSVLSKGVAGLLKDASRPPAASP